jgi:hypothetical protein
MIRGRAIFLACLIALLYWAPEWMPRAAENETSAAVKRATSVENDERLLGDAERNRATLTPEQRALLDDLKGARSDISRSKVREKLLDTLDPGTKTTTASFYEWAADGWRSAQTAYARERQRAEHWLWSIVILIAAAGVVTALLSQPHIARIAGRVGIGIARSWLVVLSFVAMAVAIMTRTNPWIAVPDELIFAPIAALAASAFALHLADFNYPVWNSLIRACGAPVISMAFITAYLKLV